MMLNILLLEDTETSITSCKDVIEEYFSNQITVTPADEPQKAIDLLSNHFDAAIVDLRLKGNTEGSFFIEKMQELGVKIPMVIHTATPDDVLPNWCALEVFTRGDPKQGYKAIFEYLQKVLQTGITEIVGLSGLIEKKIQQFYKDYFFYNRDLWIERASTDPQRVKDALYRSLIAQIDSEAALHASDSYPEEFYIPAQDPYLYTGSIVVDKASRKRFVILSPACDIALRDGKPKIKSITMCEIQPIETHGLTYNPSGYDFTGKKINKFNPLFQNSNDDKDCIRYHWLPNTKNFEGGIVNFTMPMSWPYEEFFSKYDLEPFRIARPFVKNILARFSSYYARQGQPDVGKNELLSNIKSTTSEHEVLMP